MPPVPEATEPRGAPLPAAREGATAASAPLRRPLAEHPLPRFLAVGGIGFSVDAFVFSLAAAAGAADWLARAVSLAVATIVTWRLNRRFTFRPSGRRSEAEAMRYAGVALCAQALNYGLFLALRAVAPALWPVAALAASAGSAAGFSFAGQALVTFRPRGTTPMAAPPAGAGR
ncbi:GtrA family protein [Enterovirga aerilata]|uniref:GtrA family protein n=1 Tax=Enterovirga aerilata TaxID=2730920 RepID=A0A849IEQ6_9HYPH|nr:GtrA family protein [Enterovirga sp. DB1703]